MNQVILSERIPIKMWLDDIECGAFEQVKNIANLPFTFHHIAIMPDSHQGYGMPIGGVMADTEVVIPNAVGVDIGCGMCAVKTNLLQIEFNILKEILKRIRKAIPVGMAWHKEPVIETEMPSKISKENMPIVWQQFDKARKQIGTLGSGNHFIEIQKGSDGVIWIMIHSGSRNIGKQVADHYNKLAVKLNKIWFSCVPKEWQLAFLPLETTEAQNYINEMKYCVDFAFANRKQMMSVILTIFDNLFPDFNYEETINIAHNYAAMEHHFGKNVMIHRKGATQAKRGQVGIVPGSQGTKSYIVCGTGNPDSFQSCSHGAGRKMGRKQAQRELSLDGEISYLDKQNILHSIRGLNDLDEAPGAYKDINVVMKNQNDLVGIIVELIPLAVIKG